MKAYIKDLLNSLWLVPMVSLMDSVVLSWLISGTTALFTLSQLGLVGISTKCVDRESVFSMARGEYIDVINVGYFEIWFSLLGGVAVFLIGYFIYGAFFKKNGEWGSTRFDMCSLNTFIGLIINIAFVGLCIHFVVEGIVEKYKVQVPFRLGYVYFHEVVLILSYIASLIASVIKYNTIKYFFVIKDKCNIDCQMFSENKNKIT